VAVHAGQSAAAILDASSDDLEGQAVVVSHVQAEDRRVDGRPQVVHVRDEGPADPEVEQAPEQRLLAALRAELVWARSRHGTLLDALGRTFDEIAADPSVQDVASVNGFSLLDGSLRNNAAVLFVSMKPFDQRGDASLLSFAALPRINQQLAGLTEGFALAVNPPPIPGLGTTGGFEMYLQNRGAGDQQATSQAVQAFIKAARARPELSGVSTTYRGATQQLFGQEQAATITRQNRDFAQITFFHRGTYSRKLGQTGEVLMLEHDAGGRVFQNAQHHTWGHLHAG
jgi:hypothetical protein